jgi:hypothetical protein
MAAKRKRNIKGDEENINIKENTKKWVGFYL